MGRRLEEAGPGIYLAGPIIFLRWFYLRETLLPDVQLAVTFLMEIPLVELKWRLLLHRGLSAEAAHENETGVVPSCHGR